MTQIEELSEEMFQEIFRYMEDHNPFMNLNTRINYMIGKAYSCPRDIIDISSKIQHFRVLDLTKLFDRFTYPESAQVSPKGISIRQICLQVTIDKLILNEATIFLSDVPCNRIILKTWNVKCSAFQYMNISCDIYVMNHLTIKGPYLHDIFKDCLCVEGRDNKYDIYPYRNGFITLMDSDLARDKKYYVNGINISKMIVDSMDMCCSNLKLTNYSYIFNIYQVHGKLCVRSSLT